MENNIIKGGPGSGSWEGPGQPRFARSIRQSLEGLSPEKRGEMLEKLKAERYTRLKRKPGERSQVGEKPEAKPKDEGVDVTRRGHPAGIGGKDDDMVDDIKETTGVDLKTAKMMLESMQVYSDGGFSDIRSGKDKNRADTIENFIEKSPKWPLDTPLYRGINVDKSFLANIKVGSSVDMKGISSWSSDKKVADMFTTAGLAGGVGSTGPGGARIVFRLSKSNRAVAISHLSEVKGEKEVVLSGRSNLSVTSFAKKGEITYVDLQEIGLKRFVAVVFSGLDILTKGKAVKGPQISIHEKWNIDSSMVIISPPPKKEFDSVYQEEVEDFIKKVLNGIKIRMKKDSVLKGGPGSGSWSGPGQPRSASSSYNEATHNDFVKVRNQLSEDKKYYVTQYSADEMKQYGLKTYLSKDKKSGYAIAPDGDLINVFSLNDLGKKLVADAIGKGAKKLDCFDGKLPRFYKECGFMEYKREKNWTVGDPDVIYMRIKENR